MLDTTRVDGWVCITSIKLFAKCLTTANIPLPPAEPIDVLAFVTLLEKQSSRCVALVLRGNGKALVELLRLLAGTRRCSLTQRHTQTPKRLTRHTDADYVVSWVCRQHRRHVGNEWMLRFRNSSDTFKPRDNFLTTNTTPLSTAQCRGPHHKHRNRFAELTHLSVK